MTPNKKRRKYARHGIEVGVPFVANHKEQIVEEIVEEDVPEVEEESLDTISKPICFGFVDNCESLRIRQVPNPVGEILTTISSGTEVEIDLDNSTNDFYKVCTATGLDGYCMKKFITLR